MQGDHAAPERVSGTPGIGLANRVGLGLKAPVAERASQQTVGDELAAVVKKNRLAGIDRGKRSGLDEQARTVLPSGRHAGAARDHPKGRACAQDVLLVRWPLPLPALAELLHVAVVDLQHSAEPASIALTEFNEGL